MSDALPDREEQLRRNREISDHLDELLEAVRHSRKPSDLFDKLLLRAAVQNAMRIEDNIIGGESIRREVAGFTRTALRRIMKGDAAGAGRWAQEAVRWGRCLLLAETDQP